MSDPLTDGMTALAEYNPLPVAIFDPHIRYRLANAAARMLIPGNPIGMTPTETVLKYYQTHHQTVPQIYIDKLQEWEQQAQEVLRSRIPYTYDQLIETAAGVFHYQYTLIPKLDAQGQGEYLISVCQDMTPLYEANLQIVDLVGSQQEQQTTLAQLVHDQRNNLNNLYFTALAMTRQSFEKRMNYFLVITTLIEQARDISEDIEILSQKDNLPINLQETDVYDLIEVIVKTFATIHMNYEIGFEYEGERMARMDRKLVRRMLGNLVSNAIKYSAVNSTVKICAVVRGDIHLEVIDNGPGISPADQKNVFTMFYRGENTKGTSGHGIGLASVQACVLAHSGTIELTSILGEGTCFKINLPNLTVPSVL